MDKQIFIKGFKEPTDYFTGGTIICDNPKNPNYGEFRVIKKYTLHKGNIAGFKFFPFSDSSKITYNFKEDYRVQVFSPYQEIFTKPLNLERR